MKNSLRINHFPEFHHLETLCSTSELVNYIFLWVPTHIGLSYTSNYRYTNVNLVPTI